MSVRHSYPDGKCPKCGEPIPKQAKEGDKCDYCDEVLHEYAEVAKTENTNCLAGMKCPKCGALEPFDILAITTVMMFDDGTDPDEPQGDLEWDNESSCMCLACRHTGKVRDFKEGAPEAKAAPEATETKKPLSIEETARLLGAEPAPMPPKFAAMLSLLGLNPSEDEGALKFFMSIFQDLTPEDRKHLISDWTTHGRIVIDNKDGMPHAGDPDAEGVTT